MTAQRRPTRTPPTTGSAPWSLAAVSVTAIEQNLPLEELAWQDDALCREMDPELFFAESSDPWSQAEAKRACGMCPVHAKCLEWRLSLNSRDDEYGFFGGFGAKARRQMRARLKREAAA